MCASEAFSSSASGATLLMWESMNKYEQKLLLLLLNGRKLGGGCRG